MKRNQEIKWRSAGLVAGVMQGALKNNQLTRAHPGVPVYPDRQQDSSSQGRLIMKRQLL